MKNLFFLLAISLSARAQGTQPIQIFVDLTDAPRKILHAHLTVPVKPGPLTLAYPQWIPGEHSPTGPIDNFAGLKISGNGQPLAWRRDDVNMFAFHITAPAGVHKLEIDADFLATAAPSGFSAGASTGPNLAVLSWNELALYPQGETAAEVRFEPPLSCLTIGNLRLP